MKIAVIFTGGTIGSTIVQDGYIAPDRKYPYKLLDLYEKKYGMEDDVEFKTIQPYQILSENLCADNLNLLIRTIRTLIKTETYDGIIVTHGTDTLQYTAAILSYVFGNSSIAITIVSSDYPPEDKRANGLENLQGAITFLKYCKRECRGQFPVGVFVSYENKGDTLKIHRGSRLLPHMPYSASVYSICNQFYGEIKNNQFIKNKEYTTVTSEIIREKCYNNEVCLNPSKDDILRLVPYVGMTYPDNLLGKKAVLHESFHSGTIRIAKETSEFAGMAGKANIPVYVSGVPGGGAMYETVGEYERLGFRVLPVMSPIAAYCKLWLALSNGWDVEQTMKSCISEDCVL